LRVAGQAETTMRRADSPFFTSERRPRCPYPGLRSVLEVAKRAPEAAQNALSRDFGQAVANASWTFLRDKCD
jgi:hypothetical protein